MGPSDLPAERHRRIAGVFTGRVRGTRSRDAPSPVAGWTARDVVRHLTGWFPAFLASGAGVGLPRGPSVDEDPSPRGRCTATACRPSWTTRGPRTAG
ncbi:MAG: maleylpyruvate isomerase N-terminal domain-containing protein [Actinomadura sp.]